MAAPVVDTVLTLRALVKCTGPANETRLSLVWMLPPIETAPAPVCCRGPVKEKLTPPLVSVPELSNTIAPPPVVEKAPLKEIAPLAILTPPERLVAKPPEKVVVPEPPVWVSAPTLTPP